MTMIGSSGVLAPGKLRWLRALAWMAALCLAMVIGFNAATRGILLLLASGSAADAGTKLLAAVAGCAAILLLYWLAIRFGERRNVPELSLHHGPLDLVLGVTIGTAAISAIVGVLWAGGWVVIEPQPVESVTLALRDAIRSGVFEELVLRLVIFRLLWRAAGIWPAMGLSALLFGALHLANPDSSLFAALCLIAGEGIVIGLYLITGRIWASIGMHAAWNFAQGWLFGAAVSGTSSIAGGPLTLRPVEDVSQLLSGGGFGPEGSLAALIISLAGSVVVLRLAWQRGRFKPEDEEALPERESAIAYAA